MNREPSLIELIQAQLHGDLHELPVFHEVAVKLQQVLARKGFKIEEVVQLIGEDPAIACQVLKVANSLYFAGLSKVATIKDAIVRLGAQEIANLAMLASQAKIYKSENKIIDSYMQRLWGHATSCAVGAKWLAMKLFQPSLAQEAFMGGLLHDIGKLAIVSILDNILRSGNQRINFSELLINEILDTMHEEVGYQLMRSWSLPESYCNIALNHHKEEFDGSDVLLVIVRLSDLACRKAGKVLTPDPTINIMSSREAQCLGIKELTAAELEIVIEDALLEQNAINNLE
jgi:HD-like signal output (HDOD) protein